jgi:FixJ family two-component response regulator
MSRDPTVFVVDDDASVRKALARLFESADLRAETFSGAAEFLARAPVDERGCLVLDIKMPIISGLDLQGCLESAGIYMPVIFLSAHTSVPLTVRAMKDGAFEVFVKPFQQDVLLEAVRRAIAIEDGRLRERAEYLRLRRRHDTLTARERTVLSLVVTGMLNKQVAAAIGTSVKTVKVHRSRAMKKMQASSLADLVRMADRIALANDMAGADARRR